MRRTIVGIVIGVVMALAGSVMAQQDGGIPKIPVELMVI